MAQYRFSSSHVRVPYLQVIKKRSNLENIEFLSLHFRTNNYMIQTLFNVNFLAQKNLKQEGHDGPGVAHLSLTDCDP